MHDPAPFRDLLERQTWRLYVYLRALLPGETEADSAFEEVLVRIQRESRSAPAKQFSGWCEGIARQVAFERRKTLAPLPFSDDLFRQLADIAGTLLDRTSSRGERLEEILGRLPPPERELLRRKHELGLSVEQIAVTEERTASLVSRDLTLLNATLVASLHEAAPDGGPAPPGGAMDLGRLADQLLDGTLAEDGRLVLETLLLADSTAQAHYLRHVALASDLKWKYRGELKIPPASPKKSLSFRERAITIAFLIACLEVIALVAYVVGNRLGAW